MTLRKRLFWLFGPPLAVALLVVYLLAHGLILNRLDREDDTLLVAEAEQVRALLDNLFERDRDRLQNFVSSLAPAATDILPVTPRLLSRMNFDFLVHLDGQGKVSAAQWQALEPSAIATLEGVPQPGVQALHDDVLRLVQHLERAGNTRHYRGQLVAVQGAAMILVAVDIGQLQPGASGTLFAGHFLSSTRTLDLERKLNGKLRLRPPPASPAQSALFEGQEQITISPRQVVDDNRQRIFLQFSNSLDEPQLMLELPRERHLYVEGRQQIDLFLGVITLVVVLAWLLVYLGLDVVLLRRVSRMHQEFLAIGPESAGRRLSDRGADELGALGREANRMLDRLEQSEARDRAILQAMQEGYFELDRAGLLLTVNPAFSRRLGLPGESLVGRPASDWLEGCDETRLREVFGAHRAQGAPVLAGRMHRADGSLGHYETHLSQIIDAQDQLRGYRGILHDISDHVEYQNQLFDMAYRDALTGLGNRKAFYEHLKRCVAASTGPLALLFIDLDRFKQVNDTFGHDIGDSLLVQMANRLREGVRKPDRAYRLGGDEFTLILPGTHADEAQRLAIRLLRALGEPVQVGQQAIDFVTPSIGIALYPQHAGDLDGLVKAADQAMYEAKQQRNQVCLFSAQDTPIDGR